MLPSPEITLITDFLPNHAALFDELMRSVHWDERLRARKTASFGVSYDYSGMTYPEVAMPERLQTVCADIERMLNHHYN